MPKPPLLHHVHGAAGAPQRMSGLKSEPLPRGISQDVFPRGISQDVGSPEQRGGFFAAGPLAVGESFASRAGANGGPLFANASPPGRVPPIGPGGDGTEDNSEPRQLTTEDMSRIVAGTELQTDSSSSYSPQRPRELQSNLSGALDLAKQTRPDDGAGEAQGCFHVRHVEVTELLEDNTLGLLLHGTSVVGFCSSRAEAAGWRVGDQIVEVNGQRVGSFDEFLERFVESQVENGLPIDFSVLRREQRPAAGEVDEAEDALENFFSATNFVDLAGQLQRKFGSTSERERNQSFSDEEGFGQIIRSESMSILENPYIQALRRRRDELFLSTEGWTGAVGTPASASIASRLATRGDAGIATLEDPVDRSGPLKPCGWPFCISEGRANGCREAPWSDVLPTPRADQFDSFDSHCATATRPVNEASSSSTWAVFDATESSGAPYISAPCADAGVIVTAPYDTTTSGSGSEKENSAEPEARLDKGVDGSSPDDIKNSAGDPAQPTSASAASRNFASRLLPIGNAGY